MQTVARAHRMRMSIWYDVNITINRNGEVVETLAKVPGVWISCETCTHLDECTHVLLHTLACMRAQACIHAFMTDDSEFHVEHHLAFQRSRLLVRIQIRPACLAGLVW